MMTSPAIEICRVEAPPTRSNNSRARRRFTIDGSDELENQLAHICEEVLHGVSALIPACELEAILLAGGYGRGEGGVLTCADDQHPYNDMEFYVFVRGNRFLNERRFGHRLHELAEHLSSQAGIEIELKIDSLAKLRSSPPSMFCYDLVTGHHWLAGHEALLAGTEHHREAGDIPLSEATRLVMNRGSGLLFAREVLERQEWTAENADFVARNIAKAELALGDAVLTVYGRYHWSCRERNRRLHDLVFEAPHLSKLREFHDRGVAFKLHPELATDHRELLRHRLDEVTHYAHDVFLWLERRRLGKDFSDVRKYALHRVNKCPELSWVRNVLVNVKTLGFGAFLANLARHPRERILNAMALLLWTAAPSEPGLRTSIQRFLHSNATSFAELVGDYRRLWGRLN
jgi:hypothetical protein